MQLTEYLKIKKQESTVTKCFIAGYIAHEY